MTVPTSYRRVNLIDGRCSERSFVDAQIYRDYPIDELENVESLWSEARERAAAVGDVSGLAPLEHAHWDWRNKTDSVEAHHHMLVAVECGDAQGLMAVLRTPRPARLKEGNVVYVDYLESAPWNLKGFTASPKYLGIGTVLLAEAIRISYETGLSGLVGLHSLPQSEAFYSRCRMTRVAPDADYFDLVYFEYKGQDGIDWLTSLGETL